MKITVHGDRCTGHGRCYGLAPGFLDYDDEGFVTIRDQTVEVPAGQTAASREAARTCPEQAIELLDD
jgi:ferredoxin